MNDVTKRMCLMVVGLLVFGLSTFVVVVLWSRRIVGGNEPGNAQTQHRQPGAVPPPDVADSHDVPALSTDHAKQRESLNEPPRLVPPVRRISAEGSVRLRDDMKGWICVVQMNVGDQAVAEAEVVEGKFSVPSDVGTRRLILRLGPKHSQLVPVDMGAFLIESGHPIVLDATRLRPIRLHLVKDPQCRRGPSPGDTIRIIGRAITAPPIQVDNRSGSPESLWILPGDYYVTVSGKSEDTGAAILAGRTLIVDGSLPQVQVPIGFTEEAMTVRAELTGPMLEPIHLMLPDGSHVPLDKRGQVDLPEALPEGSPVWLAARRDGRWTPMGAPVLMRIEVGADGRPIGVVPRK